VDWGSGTVWLDFEDKSRQDPSFVFLLAYFTFLSASFWVVEAQMKFWAGWGTLGRYENTER
jgi:hypothetical protein